MPKLEIKNHKTDEVIYEGAFETARTCIEQAVIEQINLDYADLRHTNLSNATLDDAVMRYALFDGANLSGANLSETQLNGTSFTNATLHNTCLCESDLQHCNFEDALFGATDIAGSTLSHCRFSTLSAFSLNFMDSKCMSNCIFCEDTTLIRPFSQPPIVIHGLAMPVIFMDEHLKIGRLTKSYQEWFAHINDNTPPHKHYDGQIITFFRKYQSMFREMYEGLHSPVPPAETLNRVIAN